MQTPPKFIFPPHLKTIIRETMLENGYTVKEGQDDLKPYVYEASLKLLERVFEDKTSSRYTNLMSLTKRIGVSDPGLLIRNLFSYQTNRVVYHTVDHCLEVAVLFDYLMKGEGHVPKEHQLLAAAYHDISHSGGSMTDVENTELAAKIYAEICQQYHSFTQEEIEEGKRMILCTVFPFTIEPTTPAEMALRDADLLYSVTQSRETCSLIQVQLLTELRNAGVIGDTTMAEWGERNKAFYASATFYTDHAKWIMKNLRESYAFKRGGLYYATEGLKELSYVAGKHTPVGQVGDYFWTLRD